MKRSCLYLCDQTILFLCRGAAYFCAIRLSYYYVKVLPTSKRLGYPIVIQRSCLFLYNQAILLIYEKLPISMQQAIPLLCKGAAQFCAIRLAYCFMRSCLFLCDQAVLLLSRDDAYFYESRLSYCYTVQRSCLSVCDQAVLLL